LLIDNPCGQGGARRPAWLSTTVGSVTPVLGLDWAAVLRGAAVAVAISLPTAVLGGVVDDDRGNSPVVVRLLFFAVLLGFVAGGFVAARASAALPYSTGAVAAVTGFVVVQLVAAVVRITAGDGVPIAPVAFYAFVSYGCGLTGAVAGTRRART
jgi:hypothetical protein